MSEQITITKQWFDRLQEIIELIAKTTGEDRICWIEHLKGYVSSLDYFWEKKET